MTTHMTGTREEWLAARIELLEAEKELTRRSDELARRRQELPWVRVDKEYRFETKGVPRWQTSSEGALPPKAHTGFNRALPNSVTSIPLVRMVCGVRARRPRLPPSGTTQDSATTRSGTDEPSWRFSR
jgi:hypothetical protein